MSTSYEILNAMETVQFIGGTEYRLNFTVYQEDGVTPIDLTGGAAEYRLSPLGQPTVFTLKLDGAASISTNTWYVDFAEADTEDLSGVYIGQPVMEDASGAQFIPAQGRVVILPLNPAS